MLTRIKINQDKIDQEETRNRMNEVGERLLRIANKINGYQRLLYTKQHDFRYIDFISRGVYPEQMDYDYEPTLMDFKLDLNNKVAFDLKRYNEITTFHETLDTAGYSPYFRKKQRFNSIDFNLPDAGSPGIKEFSLPLLPTKLDETPGKHSVYANNTNSNSLINKSLIKRRSIDFKPNLMNRRLNSINRGLTVNTHLKEQVSVK